MSRWEIAQEKIEAEERRLHEEGECVEHCSYCADDEEQMSRDIDELAEHINDALDKERGYCAKCDNIHSAVVLYQNLCPCSCHEKK